MNSRLDRQAISRMGFVDQRHTLNYRHLAWGKKCLKNLRVPVLEWTLNITLTVRAKVIKKRNNSQLGYVNLYYLVTIVTVDIICDWNIKLDPRELSHVKLCLREMLGPCGHVG